MAKLNDLTTGPVVVAAAVAAVAGAEVDALAPAFDLADIAKMPVRKLVFPRYEIFVLIFERSKNRTANKL